MSSGQSFIDMLTQEEEPDIEVLTQMPTSEGGSKGRGRNFTYQEDLQLCWSWMNVTYDPRAANEQSRGTYWNRIAEHYHENKTIQSDRNATSLEKRWGIIQKECFKFQGCFEKVERLRPSGVPYTEHVQQAQHTYGGKKGFPFLHCWTEVRHSEKFLSLHQQLKQPHGKTDGSKTADLPGVDPTHDSSIPPPSKRPPGRKQSKQKAKNNEGQDDYADVLGTLVQMKTEEQQKREDRWKLDKELEEKKLAMDRELEERKLAIEERRLQWDQEQKIMFCDVSTLDESQRAYVMAMRQDIARAKVASVKASSEGSGC